MELQEKVLSDCIQHVQQVLKGELKVDIIEAHEEWDETLQRNVLDQSMMVKIGLQELEIITDEYGMLAGFIDHAQWKNCTYQPVTIDRILNSAYQSGWIPLTTRADSEGFKGKKGEAVIKIRLDERPASSRFIVGFNPSTSKIIYLIPDRLDPYAN